MNNNDLIMVTGSRGQLGYDIVKELKNRRFNNIIEIDKDIVDITNEEEVKDVIFRFKPLVVIHCAAWTDIRKAESMMADAYNLNVNGTRFIAEACKKIGAKLVYISSSYVFDGKRDYNFEIEYPKDGDTFYGKTKSQGEDIIRFLVDKYFIIRTSWLFGINGNNFIKSLIEEASSGVNEINAPMDQIASPTYTVDLARVLASLIQTEKYGIYHATNEGFCSPADIAEEICRLKNLPVKVKRLTTRQYKKLFPNEMIKPINSRLGKRSLDKAGIRRLPEWQNALERYLEELKK